MIFFGHRFCPTWQTVRQLFHAVPNLEVDLAQAVCFRQFSLVILFEMAPAMKVTKAKKVNTKGQKAMTKGNLMGELANATELKKSDISSVLNSLAEIGTAEVKKSGKFVLPGLCMIKTKNKPAKKAGKRVMFGKEVMIKAQPAKTVVKAFPVSSLKKAL